MSVPTWSRKRQPPRRNTDAARGVNPLVQAATTLLSAAILLSVVAIPQWLSKQARWDALSAHVGEVGRLAASVVDGDLHRRLLDPANYTAELYAQAVKPLVRFHSADPNITYLYTMFEQDGVPHFVLDTAASPDLRTSRELRPSAYMERFDLREEYEDGWLKQLASGADYVTPTYQQDEYGDFLTAHVPIHDSQGRYSGFVGVDFDLQFYFAQEARFRAIAIGSLLAALIVALIVGYMAALYHSAMQHRVETLYDASVRDGLTRLFNRRGAIAAVKKLLARQEESYAALLIDIDGLKVINDMRGHTTGDAVIARTADAIRDSARDGDVCARLGGDEFLVFAACDSETAMDMAERILRKLARPTMQLAGVRVSASIGVAVHDGAGADFDRMYRDADVALLHARTESKCRIGLNVASAVSTPRPYGISAFVA